MGSHILSMDHIGMASATVCTHIDSGGSGGGGLGGLTPPPPEVFFCLSVYENSCGPGP